MGCQTSMGSHRVGHDWSDLGAVAAAVPWEGAINMNSTLTLSSRAHLSRVDIYINNHKIKKKTISALDEDRLWVLRRTEREA